jgi:hypothetical protein
LPADAVSDGLPSSQFVARSSRTCGEKFVRSDAKEFRSRIDPQQKSLWLCDVRCWPPSPLALPPFEGPKWLTCRFATENVARGVARIPDSSGYLGMEAKWLISLMAKVRYNAFSQN